MNILYTNEDPQKAADELCDIHLTSLLLQYALLLSCCHRKTDGFGPMWLKHNGNDRKWWLHDTDSLDEKGRKVALTGYVLLAGMNMDHPALHWLCQGKGNYVWLFRCWERMLENYEKDKGTPHEYFKLYEVLFDFPEKLPEGATAHPKIVYPEFRHITPTTEAYHAHINHKLTLPEFRGARFKKVTPDWLRKLPPKSYTQKKREEDTKIDEGPPRPAISKKEMVAPYGGSKKVPKFNAPPKKQINATESRSEAGQELAERYRENKPSKGAAPNIIHSLDAADQALTQLFFENNGLNRLLEGGEKVSKFDAKSAPPESTSTQESKNEKRSPPKFKVPPKK